MDLRLSRHVAVVTGASKGIGLAVTRTLLDEGAREQQRKRNVDAAVRRAAQEITDQITSGTDGAGWSDLVAEFRTALEAATPNENSAKALRDLRTATNAHRDALTAVVATRPASP